MSDLSANITEFYAAESDISAFVPTTLSGASVWKFQPSGPNHIPLHVRTGAISMGQPAERKRFTQIEFHGKGTLWVRIYVDGVFVIEGQVTLTETPSKDRRLGIPVGTKGYIIDAEFAGDADIRAVEFAYAPMGSTS